MRKPVFEGIYCNTDECCPYKDGQDCLAYGVYIEDVLVDGEWRDPRCPACITEFGTGDLIEDNEFAPGVCSAENWTKD